MLPGAEPIPSVMADSAGAPLKLDYSIPLEPLTHLDMALQTFAQQPLLLLYFSPKCPHCRHDFPDIQKLAREYKGVAQTIAVSVSAVNKRDILGFVEDFGEREIPFFQDANPKPEKEGAPPKPSFGALYGDGYVPRLYLVNPDGTLTRYTDFSANGLSLVRKALDRYKKYRTFMPFQYPKIVAFDVETTGLVNTKDDLIELGAVKFSFDCVNGRIEPVKIDEFQSFVNPVGPLKPEAQAANHITEEMVKDAPKAGPVLLSFNDYVKDAVALVAHNAPFDVGFLNTHYGKFVGANAPALPVFDSLVITRNLMPLPSYKLGDVVKKLKERKEIPFTANDSEMHRAVYDCEMLMHLFAAVLRTRLSPEDFALENFMAAMKNKAKAGESHIKPRLQKQPKLF
jgi:DNA polymerase III epsilon subunit family exonuclease